MKCKTEFSIKVSSCKGIGIKQIKGLIATKITVINKLVWWVKNNSKGKLYAMLPFNASTQTQI